MAGQPGQQYYSINVDTESSFDQLPFGKLVQHVFSSYAFASEHDILTAAELRLIHHACTVDSKPERSVRLFEEACSWYREARDSGERLDLDYMANVLMLADDYEA